MHAARSSGREIDRRLAGETPEEIPLDTIARRRLKALRETKARILEALGREDCE